MVLNFFVLTLVYTQIVFANNLDLSYLKNLKYVDIEKSKSSVYDPKKETIIYFWATWCPDCKDKLTSVFQDENMYSKYNVYLVSTDKDIEKIAYFKNKNNIKNYVYSDDTKNLQKALQVFSVPTLVKLKDVQNKLNIIKVQTGGDITSLIK